jgi:transposase
MVNYTFVGVDIAKMKFNVALSIKGKWIESTFENAHSGHEKFTSWLQKHTQDSFVCLESTGPYGERLSEFLHDNQIKVSVVNPMKIKHYAKSMLSRNKNDQVDARVIALYAEKMRPATFVPKSNEQKLVREWVQLIDTLSGQKRQLENQLESVQSKAVEKEIKNSINQLERKIAKIEFSLNENIKNNEQSNANKQRLLTITGIGEKTANQIIAYLPRVSEFKNAKQLAAYIGVTPRQYQSGKYTGKTRLSKYGNSRLRKALYMPALVAKNTNPHLREFCERLEKNGLKPKQIICAVMRKLIHIIFGMLKHQQNFNPNLV